MARGIRIGTGALAESDLHKHNAVDILSAVLFRKQYILMNQSIEAFIKELEPQYNGFQIHNRVFRLEDPEETRGIKELLIFEDSPLYEQAHNIYRAAALLKKDREVISHFLAMFINKCSGLEAFFKPFPKDNLLSIIDSSKLASKSHFISNLTRAIMYRQRVRPTKPHQYEIFINDNADRIDMVNGYITSSILVR